MLPLLVLAPRPSAASGYARRWSSALSDTLENEAFGSFPDIGKKATHLCPCGYYNHPQKECTCESGQVNRYLNKVSGPLLDRIDLHIQVNALPIEDMAKETEEEDSAIIRERVIKARAIQADRYKGKSGIYINAQMITQ